MAASNYQFIETRDMFKEYLSGYPTNLTYEEWKSASADDKAALLFVRFYEEITLAWYNAVVSLGVVHITQEDGVSIVLQYLMKNVAKIDEDEKRYKAQYIYKVCYHCLLDLWETRGTDMKRSSIEISNEYTDGDEVTVDLFDLAPSEDEDIETQKTKEAIWEIIRRMGPKAEKVVNHILNPDETLHRIAQSSAERPLDRLADVSVSKAEYEEILAELKIKLAPFRSGLMAS